MDQKTTKHRDYHHFSSAGKTFLKLRFTIATGQTVGNAFILTSLFRKKPHFTRTRHRFAGNETPSAQGHEIVGFRRYTPQPSLSRKLKKHSGKISFT
jgi:hypothetical protein